VGERNRLLDQSLVQATRFDPDAAKLKLSRARQLGRGPRILALRFATTGTLAGAALVGAMALGVKPWALFLAWVGYGLTGASLLTGLKLLLGVAAGVVAGMFTVFFGPLLEFSFGGLAMPIALGLTCGAIAMLERLPLLNVVPALFLGMICFFAADGEPSFTLAGNLLLATALGILIGWIAGVLNAAGDAALSKRQLQD